jgi:hypothetical protein
MTADLRNRNRRRATAAAQDHLQGLRWDDGVDARQAPPHHESVLRELERLRIAEGTRKAVNLSM